MTWLLNFQLRNIHTEDVVVQIKFPDAIFIGKLCTCFSFPTNKQHPYPPGRENLGNSEGGGEGAQKPKVSYLKFPGGGSGKGV